MLLHDRFKRALAIKLNPSFRAECSEVEKSV